MDSSNLQQQIQNAVYSANYERTTQDQVLSKEEVLTLRNLLGKDYLNLKDINTIQNILVSNEIKMTNFNDHEKYIIGKYFVWVSEYAKRYSKSLSAMTFYQQYTGKLTTKTMESRQEIEKEYAGTYKLLVNTYCYLIRSPLSVKGALVNRFTTNTQEIKYSGQTPGVVPPQTQWRSTQ
jgi:hypothetical protein